MRSCRHPRPAPRILRDSAAAAALLLACVGAASAQGAPEAAPPVPAPTAPALPAPALASPDGAEGSGPPGAASGLANADPSAYHADLDEMATLQREIRLLELRQKQAELAAKLRATIAEADARAAAAAQPAPQPAPEPAPNPAGQPAEAPAAAPVAPARPDPMPVVVSILGSGEEIRATILVPFAGEFTAVKGTALPNGMRVASVSAEGVVVTDAKGRRVPLSFGSAVPRFPGSGPRQAQMGMGVPMPNGVVAY